MLTKSYEPFIADAVTKRAWDRLSHEILLTESYLEQAREETAAVIAEMFGR